MDTDQLLDEIRETNLSYLLLAQQMIKSDKAASIYRLGITEEVAGILAQLTPAQVIKAANTNLLLCRFRFDDSMIVSLLSDHGKVKPMAQSHATILMTGQAAAGLV